MDCIIQYNVIIHNEKSRFIFHNLGEMYMTKRQMTPMGKEIKRRLVELEMSQADLAAEIGTSPQYINHIIFGERSGEKYIEDICRVLNI